MDRRAYKLQKSLSRVYLDVPRSEIAQAKEEGARFDWDTRQWYARTVRTLEACAQWVPHSSPYTHLLKCKEAERRICVREHVKKTEPGLPRACVAGDDEAWVAEHLRTHVVPVDWGGAPGAGITRGEFLRRHIRHFPHLHVPLDSELGRAFQALPRPLPACLYEINTHDVSPAWFNYRRGAGPRPDSPGAGVSFAQLAVEVCRK